MLEGVHHPARRARRRASPLRRLHARDIPSWYALSLSTYIRASASHICAVQVPGAADTARACQLLPLPQPLNPFRTTLTVVQAGSMYQRLLVGIATGALSLSMNLFATLFVGYKACAVVRRE